MPRFWDTMDSDQRFETLRQWQATLEASVKKHEATLEALVAQTAAIMRHLGIKEPPRPASPSPKTPSPPDEQAPDADLPDPSLLPTISEEEEPTLAEEPQLEDPESTTVLANQDQQVVFEDAPTRYEATPLSLTKELEAEAASELDAAAASPFTKEHEPEPQDPEPPPSPYARFRHLAASAASVASTVIRESRATLQDVAQVYQEGASRPSSVLRESTRSQDQDDRPLRGDSSSRFSQGPPAQDGRNFASRLASQRLLGGHPAADSAFERNPQRAHTVYEHERDSERNNARDYWPTNTRDYRRRDEDYHDDRAYRRRFRGPRDAGNGSSGPPRTPHRNRKADAPLVNWCSASVKGPYSGDRKMLQRQKLLLPDDTGSAFLGFWRTIRNGLSTSGFCRELLPDIRLLRHDADLTLCPIDAADFDSRTDLPPEWHTQDYWDEAHRQLGESLYGLMSQCEKLSERPIREAAVIASSILLSHEVRSDGFAVLNTLARHHLPHLSRTKAPSFSKVCEARPIMSSSQSVTDYSVQFNRWVDLCLLYPDSVHTVPAEYDLLYLEGLDYPHQASVMGERNKLMKVVSECAGLTRDEAPLYDDDLKRDSVEDTLNIALRRSDGSFGATTNRTKSARSPQFSPSVATIEGGTMPEEGLEVKDDLARAQLAYESSIMDQVFASVNMISDCDVPPTQAGTFWPP